MGSKIFLLINALVLILIVSRIIAGRKGSRPTPLNIENKKPPATTPDDAIPPRGESFGASDSSRPSSSSTSTATADNLDKTNPGFERSLNCTFVYNGHTFDVFEVLGLPAGSSRDACLRAALDQKKRDATQGEFYDALVAAVEMKLR